MVLLDAMIKSNYDVIVVHFNHQKRKESILDHNLVESVCLENKIPYHYIKLSIKNGNFQENARILRYEHLINIANSYHTTHIVTAHHGDDLAETVLMKLIRGSNLLGYSAMQIESSYGGYTYHKPLLAFSKEELYKYADTYNIKYNEDLSNQSNDYFRNRIRNTVLPIIKTENNIIEHFRSFSKQAFDASNYIRLQTLLFLKNDYKFKYKDFISLHDAIKTDLISYLLEVSNAQKSFNKVYEIITQLNSKKPNIKIKLNSNYSIVKSYEEIELINNKSLERNLSNILLNISHKKADSPYNSIELCYNKLDFPIKIRTRLPGDILSFPYGHKKLKDFLIDKKIPKHVRDTLPVIVDNNDNILWIPNIYVNQTLGDSNKVYFSIKE